MANTVKRAVKKTVKKTAKKAVKGTVNYAKGYLARACLCWFLAFALASLTNFGINLPPFLAGADTIAIVSFIVVGWLFFRRKLTPGRIIALCKTFFN